jgi:aryl-alcohol dehydrogenase-like predicted oxidoreductase
MKRPFGNTGLQVSSIGLGSSYGLSGKEVERAYERGVNFMFWGLRRRDDFGRGISRIAKRDREGLVIAAQTYSRSAMLVEPSVDSVLRSLRVDHVDILCLGWWDDVPPERILDAARVLRERGKIRSIMISCHHRPSFPTMAKTPGIESIMLRYNAAHPGAEREVFPHLPCERSGRAPGVLAFTATRWGSLLDPKFVPPNEKTPRASDCYRFAISSPHVHATLAGPKNGQELDDALDALERGPLSPEELAWMRRVGAHVRDSVNRHGVVHQIDRVRTAIFGAPHGATQN